MLDISWKMLNILTSQNLHKQDTHCDSNYTVVYQEIFFLPSLDTRPQNELIVVTGR